MKTLFDQCSKSISKLVTETYSTSFSIGTRLLHSHTRDAIYAIYGFVRFADEIVDSFHQYDKELLLNRFVNDTQTAIEEGISLNPVLHHFQMVVRKYGIEQSLIDSFFHSMKMDLAEQKTFDRSEFDQYVVGSAEVVGLMCLRVFTDGNDQLYRELEHPARKLGSAFQKVNFLRDLRNDTQMLGRNYFPGIDTTNLTDSEKREIEKEIAEEFEIAREGIARLPESARLGVMSPTSTI
ncbi:MAG: phytoene/squalene synthase family protein [Salibacteraceae bacterium]